MDCRADAGSANARVEGVANPNNHFRFRGQWQNSGVQNFCASGGKSVRLVVGKFVEQFRFGGLVRIGGVDAVHVGPDHQFVSVHDVSDERSGKIRTVPAECSDAAIACGADKSGDYGNDAIFEERQKNFAATTARFVDVRARVAEGEAS